VTRILPVHKYQGVGKVFKTSYYMILFCLPLFTNETSFTIRQSELFALKIISLALNFLVCMAAVLVHRGL